jgi:hypothetical protein
MLHIVADDLVFATLELANELYGVDLPQSSVVLQVSMLLATAQVLALSLSLVVMIAIIIVRQILICHCEICVSCHRTSWLCNCAVQETLFSSKITHVEIGCLAVSHMADTCSFGSW